MKMRFECEFQFIEFISENSHLLAFIRGQTAFFQLFGREIGSDFLTTNEHESTRMKMRFECEFQFIEFISENSHLLAFIRGQTAFFQLFGREIGSDFLTTNEHESTRMKMRFECEFKFIELITENTVATGVHSRSK